jgi:UTP-glucose-1-phosphate uridylyltransferase
MPKEMLPIIDRPVIQLIVKEAVAAGVTEVIIVTGSTKRAPSKIISTAPTNWKRSFTNEAKTKSPMKLKESPISQTLSMLGGGGRGTERKCASGAKRALPN